ncbi:MAG TPA: hypothetical protein VFJ43_16065, partial [Bacteroidia bacterium]|nr:hypothetical protein [Bacteroidia bacterium]
MGNTAAEVFRFFSTAFFSFCFFFLPAQTSPDSIPMGIISVKRPPVVASYRVSLQYFDPSVSQKHITEFSAKQIVFGDSGAASIAPQPFGDYAYEYAGHLSKDSSGNILADSASPRFSEPLRSAPTQQFDWQKYLQLMQWRFEWTDSIRSDSAQYEFSIDKKGKASIRLLPWKNEDSTQKAFEKRGLLYMGLLNQWYPARRAKGFGTRDRV